MQLALCQHTKDNETNKIRRHTPPRISVRSKDLQVSSEGTLEKRSSGSEEGKYRDHGGLIFVDENKGVCVCVEASYVLKARGWGLKTD